MTTLLGCLIVLAQGVGLMVAFPVYVVVAALERAFAGLASALLGLLLWILGERDDP